MGDNGIVKENAVHNIDRDKYDESYKRIFGKHRASECTEEVFHQEGGLICRKTVEIAHLKKELEYVKEKYTEAMEYIARNQ